MPLARVSLGLVGCLLLSGCGYVHFGRPPTATTPTGDAALSTAYSNLSTEHKILKQELVLARREGDALRASLDRAASGNSPELVARLNETTKELASLRTSYAQLQAERAGTAPAASSTTALAATELTAVKQELASVQRNYTQLQTENAKLRGDVERARAENTTLAEQLRAAVSRGNEAQAALSQLNLELVAQKEARARAEQATVAAKTQLGLVLAANNTNNSSKTGDAAATPNDGGAGGGNPLALAKAPPADASVSASLRANVDRLRANAGAPAPTASAPAARKHTVEVGDTFEKLAVKYYGAADQWRRIYDANAALLSDGRPLRAGMQLDIP